MAARYVIADEPRPSGLDHLAVNPLWPLFAQMLVGSWLALPWFLLNSMALGSVNKGRELGCVLLSLVGTGLLLMAVVMAEDNGWLAGTGIRLALLSVLALKLAMAYALYMLQAMSFEIREHFGGKARNGIFIVAAGYFLDGFIQFHGSLWMLRFVLG